MYTLVGSPMTRALRVIWCLEELGQDYELLAASPRSAEITEHNPAGKVPALLVDGEVILDSAAIIQYLADKHGALTFKPGTLARARQDSWTHFALDELDSILWQASKHHFVLPEEKRIAAVKDVCKFEFDRSIKTLEQRLGDNKYVTGDTFTVPDIITLHCLNWAEMGLKWPLPNGPVKDYATRTRQRPAYKKAMQTRKQTA